ncbi:hypothetical protein [Scytonema sp. UIC 10036]|uniref:hypothetical protein n=1 Tax=Scytonema sp. UIC 10036 TaxID=2304196 RepID=UPI001FA94700|nr:hypothetical protein [Scytonema sp. UIC 10036]
MSSKRVGKKAVRNEPIFYEERKEMHGLWLTPTAWNYIKDAGNKEGISASEIVERWAREQIGKDSDTPRLD